MDTKPLRKCPTPSLFRTVGACVDERACAEWCAELARRIKEKSRPIGGRPKTQRRQLR
jgi:hypothetical protein